MAILGIRGTGSFVTDERPKNWREMILRLYPNGAATLTALLALLESESTDDPEYNWWEKGMPTREVAVNGVQTACDTVIEITDADGTTVLTTFFFKKGDVLVNQTTKEHVRVTADQSSAVSVTVSRAFGETVAAAMADNQLLRLIGNAIEEGATCPSAINFDPTKKFNYTQIFRSPLEITRTAKKTRLRSEDAYRKAKADALEKESLDIEESFMWGERAEITGPGGQPLRATRGVVRFIEVDAAGNDNTASAGTLNETELLSYLEVYFRFGSVEKLTLAGSTALNVLTQIAKGGTTVNSDNGTEIVYGIRLKRYITAFGDLLVKQHPLFNLYTNWRQTMVVLDLKNLRYRYIDDLAFLKDRQDPCADSKKDEFLAECGLELHHAQTFGIIRGIASFGA